MLKFRQQNEVGRTKWVDTDDEDDSDALPMVVLHDDVPQLPITVILKLWGTPVEMELDTGAAVSVMSESATFSRSAGSDIVNETHLRAEADSGHLRS